MGGPQSVSLDDSGGENLKHLPMILTPNGPASSVVTNEQGRYDPLPHKEGGSLNFVISCHFSTFQCWWLCEGTLCKVIHDYEHTQKQLNEASHILAFSCTGIIRLTNRIHSEYLVIIWKYEMKWDIHHPTGWQGFCFCRTILRTEFLQQNIKRLMR
jgi:hypothetical protein